MPTTYTAAVWERPNVFTEPQTGEFHDAGGQVWDLRHERFAGGIPMDGTTDCYAAVAAAIAAPDVTRVFFPAGSFVYSGPAALEVLAEHVGMHFEGPGAELTTLKYMPEVPTDYLDYPRHGAITFNGAQFGSVTGMTLVNGGSRSAEDEDGIRQRVAGEGYDLPVHGYGVKIVDSNNIYIARNATNGGLHGVYVTTEADDIHSYSWTANRNIQIIENYCDSPYNAGIYVEHAYGPVVHRNWVEHAGYDAIKITGFNFAHDVCFNHCLYSGRDGIDTHPSGRGGRISFNHCGHNGEYGIECKGLDLEGFPDYGTRDGSFDGNICWSNGRGMSWSNPTNAPRTNFSLVSLRGMHGTGNLSLDATGAGVQMTDCQGCRLEFKSIRSAKQGASLHSTSRCRLHLDLLDAGYVEGETPAVGTFDAATFAVGSSLNHVTLTGRNSTAKPGATRYAATFDASSTGNTITDAAAEITLTGRFATGAATVAGDGTVTMDGPFDAAAPFTSQEIVSYYGSTYHGPVNLSSSRVGVRGIGSNAEFAVVRTGGGTTFVVQAQDAHALLFREGTLPIQIGVGNGRIETDQNGHWYPLDTAQKNGTTEHPWAEVHVAKLVLGDVWLLSGAVDPNGAVAAPLGSTYSNSTTGIGWQKESGGSGSTGWVAK